MAYCRNCGKELAPQAVICVNCGVPPPKGDKFCQNCGGEVDSLAEVCVKCGVRLATTQVTGQQEKSKTASVLLAVFLAFWTWLYTYKKDAWKFWTGLGVLAVNSILVFVTLGLWVLVGWIVPLGIWVWAIVDVAVKDNEWYRSY